MTNCEFIAIQKFGRNDDTACACFYVVIAMFNGTKTGLGIGLTEKAFCSITKLTELQPI